MKKLFLLLCTILTACGGGGGGGGSEGSGSAPTAAIFPNISLSFSAEVNAEEETSVTASVSDPQNRTLSSSWEVSTTGESFNYNSSTDSLSFTAPQQATIQTVEVTFQVNYNSSSTSTSSTEKKAIISIIPKIPDVPIDFVGESGSQSATFSWKESKGTGEYLLYYSIDQSGVIKNSEPIELEGDKTSSQIVSLVNGKDYYYAISAKNVTGESSLSEEVKVSPVTPSAEITGQSNTGTFDLSKLDKWGNVTDDPSEWACVKDNVTGLIWEVKKDGDGIVGNDGLQDLDDFFTFYDSTLDTTSACIVDTAGGYSFLCNYDYGYKNTAATNCLFVEQPSNEKYCNTEDFLSELNAGAETGEAYCGRSDWRLPTQYEVFQLFDFYEVIPSPPKDFFPAKPNIPDDSWLGAQNYWTSNSGLMSGNWAGCEASNTCLRTYQITASFSSLSQSVPIPRESDRKILAVSGEDMEVNNPIVNFEVVCEDIYTTPPHNFYNLFQAENAAVTKSNNTGQEWTLSTAYEVIHFYSTPPLEAESAYIITSSLLPPGGEMDFWVLHVDPSRDKPQGPLSVMFGLPRDDNQVGFGKICFTRHL